jgi:F-type H+-transporting ATPase subunit delta
MESSLRGYGTAVLQNAEGDLQAVARDLRQISDATARSSALAQVLTDEVVPAAARSAVMEDLLASRVVAPALRIVRRAILTEHADGLLSDLIDIVELARQYLDLGPREFEAEQPLLGRLGARKFAAGYATAVFEDVAQASQLEQVEGELFAFGTVVEHNAGLRTALADSGRPIDDRRDLVTTLLQGRADAVTIRLARAALFGRMRDPVGSINWMAERAADARGWRVARVTAARGLDEAERDEVSRALSELTGGPVELLVTEDPALLGGAVISIGTVLVDASIQHRLDQLEEQLLGADHFASA